MNNVESFIKTKEDGKNLSDSDINYFIKNLKSFSQEEITRWLKAVKQNGLNDNETTTLTMAMADSGIVLSWEELEPTIDKHSTGGIGDKITLLFAPLIAAYGINIPKLSGRSLGITGGTIDKLESIDGFRTNLSIKEIKEQIKKIGLAVCSAGTDLAPADKVLYAIRDVTGTVDSIPLIASSVMSKKIAGGAKNIILDVKAGSGAFMKNLNSAEELAEKMVIIGKNLNRKVKAILTNMDIPLGHAVGNTLEIREVLEVLSGKEISDLVEIVLTLATEAVSLIEGKSQINTEKKLLDLLLHGAAYKKFEDMITMQGGNLKSIFNENKKAKYIETIKSNSDGFIEDINAYLIGETVHLLGAGRKAVSDTIDHSVGIIFHKKHGESVKAGDILLEVHAVNNKDAQNAKDKLIKSFKISNNKPGKLKLIHKIVK
jgi:pyrimidine-nucleoside phosphorylase